MSSKHEIHCKIYGKVQMVMFRDFTRGTALSLGLTGTVRNMPDGSVLVVAQGQKEKLEVLIGRLGKGPFLARVIRVEVSWRKPQEPLEGFTITH